MVSISSSFQLDAYHYDGKIGGHEPFASLPFELQLDHHVMCHWIVCIPGQNLTANACKGVCLVLV